MKKRPAFRFGPATTQWPFSLEAALLIAVMALASIGLFAMLQLGIEKWAEFKGVAP